MPETETSDVTPPSEPRSISELQDRAVRGSFWTIVHVVVSVPIAFIANAIIARALGVTDYGHLAVLTLILTVAVIVTDLGVVESVVQWGAAAHARGDDHAVDRLLMASLGFRLTVQLPLMVATVVVVAHDEGSWILVAMLLSVALPALVGSAALAIRIENRTAAAARLAIVTNLAVQLVVAGTAVTSKSPPGVWAARAVVVSVMLIPGVFLLDRVRRGVTFRARLPRGMPLGFWTFALFTAAAAPVEMLVFSRSELMVLDHLGAVQAAGLFALAFGLSQQITAPVDALLAPMQPAVVGIVEAHPERVRDTLLRASRISSLLGAGLCTTAFPLLFVLIPVIYGAEWAPAAPVFLVLGMTSCLQSVINPLLIFSRARRRSQPLLIIFCLALLVDVAVAFAAIPGLGLWGAVLANVAGQLTVLISVAGMESRAWKISAPDFTRSVLPFLLACLGAGTVLVLTGVGVSGWAAVPLTLLSCVVVVTVGSRLTGSLIPERDLRPAIAILPAPARPVVAAALRLISAREPTGLQPTPHPG